MANTTGLTRRQFLPKGLRGAVMVTASVLMGVAFFVAVAFGGLLISAGPAEAQAPPQSVVLDVPWLPQVPPGDWANTKNCGQTCAAMIYGYYARQSPAPAAITANNQWLAKRFNDNSFIATPNGNVTNFQGRNALGTLLAERYGLRYGAMSGANLNAIIQQVALGRPVIAGVMIKGGDLVANGGIAHWVVVVGYDKQRQLIIVNDPGSNRGNHRAYTFAAFDATWATQGRVMAAVSR